MDRAQSQISIVSHWAAPQMAFPEAGNPYRNQRVCNPRRQNMDSYRTGGESKAQNATHRQAGDAADASTPRTTDIGMAVSDSPGTCADRDSSKVAEMSHRSSALTIDVIADYSEARSSAHLDPNAQESA